MIKFLVVEDNGDRQVNLAGAVRKRVHGVVDSVRNLHQLVTGIQPAELAEYAGVLIDFDLETEKVPGHASWPPLEVTPTLRGQQAAVPMRTGMAAFLWLRQQFATADYQRARTAWLAGDGADSRSWGSGPEPALFAFVEIKDWPSRLFAAAASSWFGATYLNAQLTEDELGELLTHPSVAAGLHTTQRVIEAGAVLDRALSGDPMGQARFIPRDRRPTAFDWYAIYFGHRGKAGFHHQALADSAEAVCGAPLTATVRPVQYQPIARALQEALHAFVVEFTPGSLWAPWGLDDRPDPMRDVLEASALFWTSADVRAAHAHALGRRVGGAG